MKVKQDTYDVGVIVGRFQVPELHEAHRELIQHVCDHHGKVVIFLGMSPLKATRENPLDFEARKQMILEAFPQVNVLYIKDQFHDQVWSRMLDERIEDLLSPSQTALLYGGRDSFIEHYSGKRPTQELESTTFYSGSAIREEVSRKSVRSTADFRAGVVWATFDRFPTSFTTVDIGVFNEDYSRLLLGRKENEKAWRLIGGFADPKSPSFEADARRETQEEAGIAITDPEYVGSFQIPDWRYRNEADKIKTILFKCKILSGAPRPGDDIYEIAWFDLDKLEQRFSEITPTHQELVRELLFSVNRHQASER